MGRTERSPRALSLLMVLLVAGLLAGCAQGVDDPPDGQRGPASEEATSEEDDDAVPFPAEGRLTVFGGDVVWSGVYYLHGNDPMGPGGSVTGSVGRLGVYHEVDMVLTSAGHEVTAARVEDLVFEPVGDAGSVVAFAMPAQDPGDGFDEFTGIELGEMYEFSDPPALTVPTDGGSFPARFTWEEVAPAAPEGLSTVEVAFRVQRYDLMAVKDEGQAHSFPEGELPAAEHGAALSFTLVVEFADDAVSRVPFSVTFDGEEATDSGFGWLDHAFGPLEAEIAATGAGL